MGTKCLWRCFFAGSSKRMLSFCLFFDIFSVWGIDFCEAMRYDDYAIMWIVGLVF